MEQQGQERQQGQACDKTAATAADEEDNAYISQMSPFELSAYRIAKSHLGTSFHLKKSNGYLKWIGKK